VQRLHPMLQHHIFHLFVSVDSPFLTLNQYCKRKNVRREKEKQKIGMIFLVDARKIILYSF